MSFLDAGESNFDMTMDTLDWWEQVSPQFVVIFEEKGVYVCVTSNLCYPNILGQNHVHVIKPPWLLELFNAQPLPPHPTPLYLSYILAIHPKTPNTL